MGTCPLNSANLKSGHHFVNLQFRAWSNAFRMAASRLAGLRGVVMALWDRFCTRGRRIAPYRTSSTRFADSNALYRYRPVRASALCGTDGRRHGVKACSQFLLLLRRRKGGVDLREQVFEWGSVILFAAQCLPH